MKIKEHYYEQTEFELTIKSQEDYYDHEWMVYFSTPFDRDGNFITEEDVLTGEEAWQFRQLAKTEKYELEQIISNTTIDGERNAKRI